MQGSSQELGACKGTGPLSSRRVMVDSESGLGKWTQSQDLQTSCGSAHTDGTNRTQ